MNVSYLTEKVKEALSNDRYEHSVRVLETARKLAAHYEVPAEAVEIAAIFHDYAKCLSKECLKENIRYYEIDANLLNYHHELWHGPVAAAIIRDKFHIENTDIINAIYYHTTGRAGMSIVEYIVFTADFTEPERNIPGIDEIRKLSFQNVETAARKALKSTIIHLMNQDATVHPDTLEAHNYLTQKWKESPSIDRK